MIRRPPRSTRTDTLLSLHDALPIFEQRRAARRGHARLFLAADDADMADSIGDVGRLEDAVTPEGGHQTGTRRLVVGVPDAMSDRIFDRRKVTAPQPVVVGQAGIERLNSRSARAVALDALDAKRGS